MESHYVVSPFGLAFLLLGVGGPQDSQVYYLAVQAS